MTAPGLDSARIVQLARPFAQFAGVFNATLSERAEQCAAWTAEHAVALGMTGPEAEQAYAAALLHDVGMAAPWAQLPASIRGRLSGDELRMIQGHIELSEQVALSLSAAEPTFAQVAHAVRHHHERWDGSGYPDGLQEEQIPVVSRWLAVCDAFLAMTNHAPYRKQPLTPPAAAEKLRDAAGSQFDAQTVEQFLALVVFPSGMSGLPQ